MKCSLCPRVAWYTVGKRGYCGDHKEEAFAEAKRNNRVTLARTDQEQAEERREWSEQRRMRAV